MWRSKSKLTKAPKTLLTVERLSQTLDFGARQPAMPSSPPPGLPGLSESYKKMELGSFLPIPAVGASLALDTNPRAYNTPASRLSAGSIQVKTTTSIGEEEDVVGSPYIVTQLPAAQMADMLGRTSSGRARAVRPTSISRSPVGLPRNPSPRPPSSVYSIPAAVPSSTSILGNTRAVSPAPVPAQSYPIFTRAPSTTSSSGRSTPSNAPSANTFGHSAETRPQQQQQSRSPTPSSGVGAAAARANMAAIRQQPTYFVPRRVPATSLPRDVAMPSLGKFDPWKRKTKDDDEDSIDGLV